MKYKNILQIDDDCDDCEFFEQALKTVCTANYSCVNNPIEALEKLISKEIKPDLIFLDLNMPLMTGEELLTEIKKSDATKNIPVILLSTAPVCKSPEKATQAKQYLIKPCTFSELKNMITTILL